MLEKLKRGRERHGLRRYLMRRLKTRYNQLFYSTDHDALVATLRQVGVEPGMTVCVHSSLSRLGYIEGGAETVIDSLMTAVGEDGSLMMPTFSMGGDMASYVRDLDVFDYRTTPSSVGIIPETFRRRDDVRRSCHPTNSVAVRGPAADELLEGHEDSLTPFGFDTPYGRFAERDDAYVLMLDTHLHSLLHHLQERVDFPNLFLEDESDVAIVDWSGNRRTVRTKVMRPRIPYFVAIPARRGPDPDWAILHDYALMFPSRRAAEVRADGFRFDGFPALTNRCFDLESRGILKSRRLGRGEIGLLHVRPFIRAIQGEMADLIERFRPCYDVDSIAAMNLPYS